MRDKETLKVRIPSAERETGGVAVDVDDHVALRRLCGELLGKNARDNVAPQTQQFLRELIARDGWRRVWSA